MSKSGPNEQFSRNIVVISTFFKSTTVNQLLTTLVKESPSDRFGHLHGRCGDVSHIIASQMETLVSNPAAE